MKFSTTGKQCTKYDLVDIGRALGLVVNDDLSVNDLKRSLERHITMLDATSKVPRPLTAPANHVVRFEKAQAKFEASQARRLERESKP